MFLILNNKYKSCFEPAVVILQYYTLVSQEIRAVFKVLDTDLSGHISFEEFLSSVRVI